MLTMNDVMFIIIFTTMDTMHVRIYMYVLQFFINTLL